MGKPIHDPGDEFGDDCLCCTPDPWPADKTPRKMTVTFVGILKCLPGPPWKEEIPPIQAVVEQDVGDPCLFVGDNCFYDIDGTDLYLTINGVNLFYDDNAWCEPFGWSILWCEEDDYENGKYTAVWYDIPGLLMWTYGLYPRPFPLHEFLGLTDDGECQVHRFCHPSDHTNIKIKFDTNLAAICRP